MPQRPVYETYSPWTYGLHPSKLDHVPDIRSAFGLAIRAARERRGWSQEQLSDAAGLDRTYVSSLERGLRNPTLITQDRLAVCTSAGSSNSRAVGSVVCQSESKIKESSEDVTNVEMRRFAICGRLRP